MAEDLKIRATLERLLAHLLDQQQQLLAARKRLQVLLEDDQPDTYLIAPLPGNKQSQWLDEILTLERLIADSKLTLLEFIPTYFKPIALWAHGQGYFVSKGRGINQREPFLVVRRQQ